MSTATVTLEIPRKKAPPVPRHGIDTPSLLATIGVVGGQPSLARFQFRTNTRWLSGTLDATPDEIVDAASRSFLGFYR